MDRQGIECGMVPSKWRGAIAAGAAASLSAPPLVTTQYTLWGTKEAGS